MDRQFVELLALGFQACFTLLQALVYLAERLLRDCGVSRVHLRLGARGGGGQVCRRADLIG